MIDFRARLRSLPRTDEQELLDRPHEVTSDLPGNLADIRFLNKWFGGVSLAVESVERLTGRLESFSVLDVGTGSADIPLAMFARATRTGRSIEVTGLDWSETVLEEAARLTEGYPVRLVQGDARCLPWKASSFDIVTCCLALHHFSETEAVQVLREMWRMCRIGIVVTDLTRGYLAYAGTWLVTRTLARNRVTQHDGPLSVRRSYTPAEMRCLARTSDLENAVVRRSPMFRQALLARKSESESV
jgi:2-polyprenyl-3-methyl-5-hydroxy-6-metoxy-1,4-benzoquinol methylase